MAGGNNNTTNSVRGSTTGQTGNQASTQGGRKGTQPLASLYTNRYIQTNLKYPSNLDSDSRGHIMQFSINDTQPSTYSEFNPKTTVSNGQITTAKSALSFQPERTRIAQTISLYIPDTLSNNYNASYTEISELDALGSAASGISQLGGRLGKFAGGISSAISATQSDAAKLALSRELGIAINPKKQLLFDGIDFRNFQFAFTFSPSSQQESDIVNQIIQTFKYHAAPRILTEAGGFAFKPPSSFTIEYLYSGKTNTYINKITECVLTDIDINYAPNGIWSAFDGTGAPTQITLSLSFKEMELVDRTKIEEGF
jgi:hypothetical protein